MAGEDTNSAPLGPGRSWGSSPLLDCSSLCILGRAKNDEVRGGEGGRRGYGRGLLQSAPRPSGAQQDHAAAKASSPSDHFLFCDTANLLLDRIAEFRDQVRKLIAGLHTRPTQIHAALQRAGHPSPCSLDAGTLHLGGEALQTPCHVAGLFLDRWAERPRNAISHGIIIRSPSGAATWLNCSRAAQKTP